MNLPPYHDTSLTRKAKKFMGNQREKVDSLIRGISAKMIEQKEAGARINKALSSMSRLVQLSTVSPDAAYSVDFLTAEWIRCFLIETKKTPEQITLQEFINWSKSKTNK